MHNEGIFTTWVHECANTVLAKYIPEQSCLSTTFTTITKQANKNDNNQMQNRNDNNQMQTHNTIKIYLKPTSLCNKQQLCFVKR